MFLSRIQLNLNNRNTMKALSSPSIFHGAVERAFTGERKRNLWRIDSLGGKMYLLLLSSSEPDLKSFCEQFGENDVCAEIKSYDKLLGRIKNGSRWRFRIVANPTKSVLRKNERGKVYPHITSDCQKKWLTEKSSKNGFLLSEDSFNVVQSKWLRFYKKESRPVSLLSVTYEGILEVTDEELFRNALINGIGRGKAYGMGLLTVMYI